MFADACLLMMGDKDTCFLAFRLFVACHVAVVTWRDSNEAVENCCGCTAFQQWYRYI